MNGQFPYSTEGDLQRYHQICHLLDQTLEATHMLIQVKFKSQSAKAALQYDDKLSIWQVLQQYYRKYFNFINGFSEFTHIKLIPVDADYYNQLSMDFLKSQLYFVISVVYVYEICHHIEGAAFQKHFVKRLKNSELSEYAEEIASCFRLSMKGGHP
ncbi:MAG: hypothetical protein KH299_06945 [Firmicutes bacterium]|nr:hypothetical protein [Bacillota bacterium]